MALGASSLEDLIVKLVGIGANESPLISCYVDFTQPREGQIANIQQRSAIARTGLRGQARNDFDDANNEILDYLRRRKPQTKKLGFNLLAQGSWEAKV